MIHSGATVSGGNGPEGGVMDAGAPGEFAATPAPLREQADQGSLCLISVLGHRSKISLSASRSLGGGVSPSHETHVAARWAA